MRIRSRLLVLVLAVLAPALVGTAIGIGYMYHEEQQFTRASVTETARALALALDREMARREAILLTLGTSPALDEGDLRRFYSFAMAVAKENDSALILSDVKGNQLLNTRLPFGATLPPMLKVERENRARLGDEVTIISDLYTPPAGLGPPSFAVQVPVRRDGKVVMFLTMASFARELQALLAAQRLPQGWHATIVDSQGIVLARSVEPDKFIGTPVREELFAKMRAQTEGVHDGINLGGAASTAFFSRAPRSGWALLVAVPNAALHGAATRTVALMATIAVVLLGLGAAAAVGVAARIARQVESLRESAHRLGANERLEPAASGTVELDAVSEAMARASDRLRGTTAELERRVAEAVSSFEQSQRALVQAQKLEALGRLTGGIAHDFNNVLQTLTAALHALRLRADEAQRLLIARCERAVTRGSQLARQLMAFARVQELRAETFHAGERLLHARELLEGALPANIVLDIRPAPEAWAVSVDPTQLELALLNLVINARDAMPNGGRIAVSASNEVVSARADLEAGEYLAITVADTGEGMSEEVLARALEPFYTTKGVGKGSGMGLPQAYGFARQNGGTLAIDSRRGAGTSVTIYLPRARNAVEAPATADAGAARAGGTGSVLLVEDEQDVRESVASALRAAGFEVETAISADDALARLRGGARFDAVFTDVVMPGAMSGIELAEYLRREHPRIGVVVATGYSDRAVDLPGTRVLAKPYALEHAVDALSAVISSASSASPSSSSFSS